MPAATTTMLGRGTQLLNATLAAPTVFTPVASVVSASPSLTTNETENKILSTTFLGYLPTNQEAEWDVTIQYIPGDPQVVVLRTYADSMEISKWRLLFPDATSKVDADGFVKSFNITVENDAIIEAELSIRITSKPTYVAVS